MASDLERLSRELGEIADRSKNIIVQDFIRSRSQSLAADAVFLEAIEVGNSAHTEPGVESVLILSPDIEGVAETPDAKKARILAIEDPLKRYRELLSIVRPPSDEELAVLRQLGYDDFTIRQTDSLGILVAQDRNEEYFADGQMEHLNFYSKQ